MKKILVLLCFIICVSAAQGQGFKAGIAGGYLSEIESVGVSADLIYEFTEKWGIANTNTFTVKSESSYRLKFLAIDLNARYKVFDELYLLAGGQYARSTFKQDGDFNILIDSPTPPSESEFAGNVGAGYKVNLVDNINLFGEVKYTFLDPGYVHARLGFIFDF